MSYHFTCSVLTISVVRLIPSIILLISLSPYSISLHPLTLLFHSVHLHLTGLRCINFLSLSQFLPYISFLFHSLDPTVHLLLLSLSFSLPYIFPSSDRMIFRRPQGGYIASASWKLCSMSGLHTPSASLDRSSLLLASGLSGSSLGRESPRFSLFHAEDIQPPHL